MGSTSRNQSRTGHLVSSFKLISNFNKGLYKNTSGRQDTVQVNCEGECPPLCQVVRQRGQGRPRDPYHPTLVNQTNTNLIVLAILLKNPGFILTRVHTQEESVGKMGGFFVTWPRVLIIILYAPNCWTCALR